MTRRRSEDARVEFGCIGLCEDDSPTWMVEGRFNAEGEFEPFDAGEMDCPECNERGEPTQGETVAEQ